jgi:hypothetical protein
MQLLIPIPLELLDLFICSINYLTFSSISLYLSPLELSDLFISPINCTPNFLFKSRVGIFFSLPVVPMVLLLFESQRYILFSSVSDWLCQVSCFYLFILFSFSILLFFFSFSFFSFFLLLVFFVPLVLCLPFCFNAQIEIVFFLYNCYSVRYIFILSRFKY